MSGLPICNECNMPVSDDYDCPCCGPPGFDASEPNLMLHLAHERLDTLASNLATAAALCAAFDLGLYNTDAGNVHPSVNWRPGCRCPAP